MSDVSVVVTSYNRPDLLRVTLESFNVMVNHDFAEKIVIDDFSDNELKEQIKQVCKDNNFKFIGVPQKFGQFRCIDAAYHLVKTPYIFHCEDDWNFVSKEYEITKGMDIEKIDVISAMKSVLEHDRNAVVVLARRDCPFGSINPQKHQTYNGIEYYIHNLWWNGQWGGYTFNPGLIRKSDYDTHIKSFYNNFTDESKVSPFYLEKGKYVVSLTEHLQCYYHIGGGRSMDPHLSNKKEI
jgi:glycosyltransferase involved in cell wall biosynthesis